ncbi:MAG: hypothetical protein JNL66_24170 [Alphaproteobacteria bacterium]|nr:hypothetical protein [Alphaproteobacteria bacterium]
MRRSTLLRRSPLIVALYALAAITLGFAHRGTLPAGDLAAFTAPDGTPAVICTTEGAGEPAHHAASGRDCEACRLTAAPGLGPVRAPALGAPAFVAIAPPAAAPAAGRSFPLFRAAARGPPGTPIA